MGSPTSEATCLDDALEELLRPRLLGLAEDLRGRPLLEDHPFVQEAHMVGDVAGEAHLVRGDQHRHPASRELADHLEHLGDELRGQPGACVIATPSKVKKTTVLSSATVTPRRPSPLAVTLPRIFEPRFAFRRLFPHGPSICLFFSEATAASFVSKTAVFFAGLMLLTM